ncbi:unnamed protein product [marine sediment metagenome]|uniref:Nicotinamide mononucleotide transporter PnuC n=1 Tax=marine sediment metagenome TaxID=412755 RepID=X0X6B9_9ZZZZ
MRDKEKLKSDCIGWVGNVFLVFDAILLAHHSLWGFAYGCMGSICYLIVGIRLRILSFIVLNLIFISINIYSIMNWLKQGY